MSALLANAVESELNAVGPDGWGLRCGEIVARFIVANQDVIARQLGGESDGATTAMDAVRVLGRVASVEGELRRAGCRPEAMFDRGARRGEADEPRTPRSATWRDRQVDFRPGQPMVDVSR